MSLENERCIKSINTVSSNPEHKQRTNFHDVYLIG